MTSSADMGAGQQDWLLRDISLTDGRRCDVAIRGGRIAAVGRDLEAGARACIAGRGRALVPGLKDHHLHLLATAARRLSVDCGAPRIMDRDGLARALQDAAVGRDGWVRGFGYHPDTAGELDRWILDAWVPHQPLRLQHASGRLWYMNSAAVAVLGDSGPWERHDGRITGRLYEADAWLRERLPAAAPPLDEIGLELARYGVVGVTDTGPGNDAGTLRLLDRERRAGGLRQRLLMMGDASLDEAYAAQSGSGHGVGAHKFHLLESALPDFGQTCARVQASHEHGRPVAFHCVSRVELVFALGVLDAAGSAQGDRIEHLGICDDALLQHIARLGLCVVSQPVFILGRGDRYLREVDPVEHAQLYRLRSVLEAGISLAGSSDAPYGELNPWAGMAAAVARRTAAGQRIGPGEALSAEQALGLYTGALDSPGRPAPPLAPGQPADLCLLDDAWPQCREDLAAVRPLLTLRGGQAIWRDPALDGD